MPHNYTQEQMWKFFEKLPPSLKEAIFSEENSENILNICEENNLKDSSSLGGKVGDILTGILPPSEFKKQLETELNMDPETAKKVFQGVYRHILYPVQSELTAIYPLETLFKGEIIKPFLETIKPIETIKKNKTSKRETPSEGKETETGKPDVYRELVE